MAWFWVPNKSIHSIEPSTDFRYELCLTRPSLPTKITDVYSLANTKKYIKENYVLTQDNWPFLNGLFSTLK